MAKPDWCPQAVWDKAIELDREMISLAPDSVEQIARAIMAETEACAVLAEKAHAAPPPHVNDRGDMYAYAVRHGAEISQRIRERNAP